MDPRTPQRSQARGPHPRRARGADIPRAAGRGRDARERHGAFEPPARVRPGQVRPRRREDLESEDRVAVARRRRRRAPGTRGEGVVAREDGEDDRGGDGREARAVVRAAHLQTWARAEKDESRGVHGAQRAVPSAAAAAAAAARAARGRGAAERHASSRPRARGGGQGARRRRVHGDARRNARLARRRIHRRRRALRGARRVLVLRRRAAVVHEPPERVRRGRVSEAAGTAGRERRRPRRRGCRPGRAPKVVRRPAAAGENGRKGACRERRARASARRRDGSRARPRSREKTSGARRALWTTTR